MTPHWRRAMTCQYMPADARFNGNRSILTRARMARLSVGDALDDEAEHPVVWPPQSRATEAARRTSEEADTT
jgi:hypothetical protein